jgi:hypothetical protein
MAINSLINRDFKIKVLVTALRINSLAVSYNISKIKDIISSPHNNNSYWQKVPAVV